MITISVPIIANIFYTHYINKEIDVDMSLRNKCYYLLGNCCWSLSYTPPKFTLYKIVYWDLSNLQRHNMNSWWVYSHITIKVRGSKLFFLFLSFYISFFWNLIFTFCVTFKALHFKDFLGVWYDELSFSCQIFLIYLIFFYPESIKWTCLWNSYCIWVSLIFYYINTGI